MKDNLTEIKKIYFKYLKALQPSILKCKQLPQFIDDVKLFDDFESELRGICLDLAYRIFNNTKARNTALERNIIDKVLNLIIKLPTVRLNKTEVRLLLEATFNLNLSKNSNHLQNIKNKRGRTKDINLDIVGTELIFLLSSYGLDVSNIWENDRNKKKSIFAEMFSRFMSVDQKFQLNPRGRISRLESYRQYRIDRVKIRKRRLVNNSS